MDKVNKGSIHKSWWNINNKDIFPVSTSYLDIWILSGSDGEEEDTLNIANNDIGGSNMSNIMGF